MEYIRHKQGNDWVWVRKDLKNKHEEHSLCTFCKWKNDEDRSQNCARLNMIYYLNQYLHMQTAIWECPDFRPLEYDKKEK